MFSMKHKYTDKKILNKHWQQKNTNRNMNRNVNRKWFDIEYIRRETYKTFDPVPILKQSNTKIFRDIQSI